MPNIKKLTLEQEIQLCEEYINTRIKEVDLAKKYGICVGSISRIRKRHNISRRPKIGMDLIPCNENYFETIDNAEKSYWLGFIAADAHVNEKDNTLAILLAVKDENHLKKFIVALESDHTIRRKITHLKSTNKNYEVCSVEITRQKLISDLKKHGIGQNKSKELSIPKSIPEQFINAFVRGYICGDGCISINKYNYISISFKSSVYSFAEEIRSLLIKNCNVNNNVITKCIGCFDLKWSNYDQCKRIYEYLYSDKGPWLDRKYELIKNYFDNPITFKPKSRRPNSEILK